MTKKQKRRQQAQDANFAVMRKFYEDRRYYSYEDFENNNPVPLFVKTGDTIHANPAWEDAPYQETIWRGTKNFMPRKQ